MHYCSQACQRNDWGLHKFECDKFKEANINKFDLKNEDDEMYRLYLRILIQVQVNNFIL